MIADEKAYRALLEYMEGIFAEMNRDKAESVHLGNHWILLDPRLTDTPVFSVYRNGSRIPTRK